MRRRPWLIGLLALGVVAVLVTGFVVVRSLGLPWLDRSECTARSGGRSVTLSVAEAQRAGRIAAQVVADGRRARAATEALRTGVPGRGLSRADAGVLASALTGNSPDGFSCVLPGGTDAASDTLGADGLVPRAERVLADLREVFGDHLPVGGFAPGGVRTGHMPGSAHYEGRAVDVFVRPINPTDRRHGWAIASYLLSQADRLAIRTLIFDDRIWTRPRSAAGWRDYDVPAGSRGDRAILEHRDHVHVDVFG
ncbi:hypothetical protein [Nocardioides sp. CER19]|uniref:hypothetical protein n=1 Tax=Nocardioides sp. CER19 TaxID=3038538 RepID=UPI00244B6389|nr:hypothetical protein [Nocardioides sp. CER19]MDH2414998.1 hypothetical protein [Nocardioides sp. CER19]